MLTFFGSQAAISAQKPADSASGGMVVIIGALSLLLGGTLRIYRMIDAYRTAETINRQRRALVR